MNALPGWLRSYTPSLFAADLVAGLLLTVLVIPQSLAYALLAGLPPQVGLLVSIFPVIAYALVGSSMSQAVGPVAITALMTYSVLSPLALPGSPQYVAFAASLALLSGVVVMLAGVLRLGFLSQLLSRPVVSGFISGSAVLIVISQLKFILGTDVRAGDAWQVVAALVASVATSNRTTLLIGGLALLVLYCSRRWLAGLLVRCGLRPAQAVFVARLMPLLVLAAAVAAVIALDLDRRYGVAVVGRIDEGLAPFSLFIPSYAALKLLSLPALVLAFIGTVQNVTMAQALAAARQERTSANRELVGLGLANIVAAFYGGMPVGGGLSRTAINVAAGAQTPVASVVTALAMLGFVAAGTQWFARLPLAVLAANIMLSAIMMVDVKALRQAWSYDRADALALLGTAAGVILLGLEVGIALGIGLSLAALLLRASTPHIAVLGRIAGTEHFRNVERHRVETIATVLFFRIDESLFFGNLRAIEARLGAEIDSRPELRDVVLIMSAVNRVDTTAVQVLADVNRELGCRAIRLHLAEVKGPVHDRLSRSPLWAELSGRVFLSANSAFEALRQAGERVAEPCERTVADAVRGDRRRAANRD